MHRADRPSHCYFLKHGSLGNSSQSRKALAAPQCKPDHAVDEQVVVLSQR